MGCVKVLGETSVLFAFFFLCGCYNFFTIRMTNVYIVSEFSVALGGSGERPATVAALGNNKSTILSTSLVSLLSKGALDQQESG